MRGKYVSLVIIIIFSLSSLVNYESYTANATESSSQIDNPYITLFNEYHFTTEFNSSIYVEKLSSHFITLNGENLPDASHNLTVKIDTDELTKHISASQNCKISNQSENFGEIVTAIFNGSTFNLNVGLTTTKTKLDPINFKILPSDTDLFSLDLGNSLRFNAWLNVTRPLDNIWLRFFTDELSSFEVVTDLQIGNRFKTMRDFSLEFLNVSTGNHYLQFEVNYETTSAQFNFSVSITEITHSLPITLYLDGDIVNAEQNSIFTYSTYSIDVLKAIYPWIYGYREPEYYKLAYESTKDFQLLVDSSSREQIEYLLIESKIKDIHVKEIYRYNSPTYLINLTLESNSTVELGLSLWEKIWFLQPNRIGCSDVPEQIKEYYDEPVGSDDVQYIDVDYPLFAVWVNEIVGNETNPYNIAYMIYQNWTDMRNYNSSLSDFNPETELASVTLETKQGVCRHFARVYSALCISAGIPVRTVYGTAFGNFNETSKKNHEWNEVYFAGYGWVTVDVTWNEFGKLPNSHSLNTLWRNYTNTLDVDFLNQSRRIILKEGSKKSLYEMLNITTQKFQTIISSNLAEIDYQETNKIVDLLNQAPTIIESGDFYTSLMIICETNVLIDSLEKSTTNTQNHFVVWVLIVVFAVVFCPTAFWLYKRKKR